MTRIRGAMPSGDRPLPDDEALSAGALDSVVLAGPDLVVPHENATSDHMQELVNAILAEGCVRHPILSIAVGLRYVLLDGTHRLAALRAVGARRVPLQVFDHDAVSFDTWAKVVVHPQGCGAVLETPLEWLRGDDATAVVRVRASNGDAWYTGRAPTTLGHRHEMVMQILGCIDDAEEVRASVPALARPKGPGSFVLRFRAWSLDEVIESALQGKRLPSGLTRVMASGRILNLRVPLAMLQDRQVDARDWEAFVAAAKRKARIYDEPTILVD